MVPNDLTIHDMLQILEYIRLWPYGDLLISLTLLGYGRRNFLLKQDNPGLY